MKKFNKKAIGLIGLIVGALVLVIIIIAIIKPTKVAFEQKIKAPDEKKGDFAPFKTCKELKGFLYDENFPCKGTVVDSGIEGQKCCLLK